MRNLFIFLSILLLLPFTANSWGFFAHQRINRLAVFLLPPEMLRLYKPYMEFLSAHATDADKRRYVLADEGPRHYIDIDHYGAPPYPSLPRSWQEALLCYHPDTLRQYGILPWHIALMMTRLTKAFQEKNTEQIMRLSADLGHYIGDAHVPLHACSNHNGQLTGQQGIHALWESRIPELLADQTFNYWVSRAVYIHDLNACTWQIITESALAADTVLQTELRLSQQYPPGTRFAYEKRNGKVVRNYAAAYTKAYHRLLGDMVERRMRKAIHMTASYWYTAWVNAGMPPLRKMQRRKIPSAPGPEGQHMLGRAEE
ncbi:zinc dependent phospholipase C family protein [Chitinophaga tropicalis]|uniref:S1/P1 Nuclease n=1 Tax=Chitinophaga tropicalis TaxID=2683588 RepID=A0A7K1TZG2_9BACT|nr:zinc dependent phospholipase C family protein [Chitinophaga tropicalis]MVT07492.1 S1/P1 Nuclease [Chitinophaga tropicalis]